MIKQRTASAPIFPNSLSSHTTKISMDDGAEVVKRVTWFLVLTGGLAEREAGKSSDMQPSINGAGIRHTKERIRPESLEVRG